MNIESLREHLALEVRGWEITGTKGKVTLESTPEVPPTYYDPKTCEVKGFVKDYKPDKNIEQVTACFDAIATEKIGWSLYLNCKPQQHVCEIYEWTHNGTKKTRLGVGVNHKKELAASIALGKATGWEDDR